ncbi:putative geranylgeranyl diphosphate synthase protein [Neofusicoccum parvum UCRNP2]|uniref:Putative geranylgeranyl diphosphate synthase protein n=1 Tax=Botryosphaeria parva (strain UCR-NP2) TaxID=1287680 RepID=R1EF06_BOTPV|nr:putative geranylgeranyl diphosphate synthase protein [Neofusicoccum parvum UCRNP2]
MSVAETYKLGTAKVPIWPFARGKDITPPQSLSDVASDASAATPTLLSQLEAGEIPMLCGGWTAAQERSVVEPYEYLSQQSGKNVRGKLIWAVNEWTRVPAERLEIIERVVNTLHTASLMIDDIQDGSTLRRGVPAAHEVFGAAQTINSANYAYFLALRELRQLANPGAVDVFVEELIELHRGQGLDLLWRDSMQCPDEDEYVHMVARKTGGLFRLAIRLMQAESDCKLELCDLAGLIGITFQIRDDYLNLCSTQYTDAKGFCEDLSEGKFSFLVIHGIHAEQDRGGNNNEGGQLFDIVQSHPTDVAAKMRAISLLEQLGSFEYTRAVLDALMRRTRRMVESFDAQAGGAGGSRGITAILDAMGLDGAAR